MRHPARPQFGAELGRPPIPRRHCRRATWWGRRAEAPPARRGQRGCRLAGLGLAALALRSSPAARPPSVLRPAPSRIPPLIGFRDTPAPAPPTSPRSGGVTGCGSLRWRSAPFAVAPASRHRGAPASPGCRRALMADVRDRRRSGQAIDSQDQKARRR
jgi:hypothetical protein